MNIERINSRDDFEEVWRGYSDSLYGEVEKVDGKAFTRGLALEIARTKATSSNPPGSIRQKWDHSFSNSNTLVAIGDKGVFQVNLCDNSLNTNRGDKIIRRFLIEAFSGSKTGSQHRLFRELGRVVRDQSYFVALDFEPQNKHESLSRLRQTILNFGNWLEGQTTLVQVEIHNTDSIKNIVLSRGLQSLRVEQARNNNNPIIVQGEGNSKGIMTHTYSAINPKEMRKFWSRRFKVYN
jgi:hypothetical protein